MNRSSRTLILTLALAAAVKSAMATETPTTNYYLAALEDGNLVNINSLYNRKSCRRLIPCALQLETYSKLLTFDKARSWIDHF